jgi:hypothetical protein
VFRIPGSSATLDDVDSFGTEVESVSDVGGPCVRYWVHDFANHEGGAGMAFTNADPGEEESGFGFILRAEFVP